MRRFVFTLLFSALFLSSGCEFFLGIGDGRIDDVNELVPLAIGSEWRYERTTIREDHPENSTTREDTLRVTEIQEIIGLPWYRLQRRHETYFSRNDDQGWVFGNFRFKFPVRAGDSYDLTGSQGVQTVTVVDTGVRKSVPAGTFTTIHYVVSGEIFGEFSCEYFIAPGVGIVASILPWVDAGGRLIMTERSDLVSFELQP